MLSSSRASRPLAFGTTVPVAMVAVLLVALCLSVTTFATASLTDFRQRYQSIMASSGKGFDMFYRDMTAPPASYQWECQRDSRDAYSVAYASATHPYTMSISNSELTLTRASSTVGVSYNLIGISCSHRANCGGVVSGSSVSFELQADHIVIVAGEVVSNGVRNFLPVAYYVLQSGRHCSNVNSANVTSVFGVGAAAVWTGLWE
ncbi:hypothetical protein JKF63_06773 [Porcisia hertigi]|uniref:Uncharacterized protein n=1 Tax=Porcisia hertigi TaxID=2761500 RepID=A0A836IU55_9TRYP|nr:hypothetical protein JKF63_06773 [Porcisia hertigi]